VKPVSNSRTTFVYVGSRPEIGDLECECVHAGLVRSFWQPSTGELAILNAGGVVELAIYSEPIPPVSLNALTLAQSEEPFLE